MAEGSRGIRSAALPSAPQRPPDRASLLHRLFPTRLAAILVRGIRQRHRSPLQGIGGRTGSVVPGGATRTGSLRLSARRGGAQPSEDRRRAETAADAVSEDRLRLRPFGGGPLPESRQELAPTIPGAAAHLPLWVQRQSAESHPGSLQVSDQHHPGPSGNRKDADDPQHRGQPCGAGEDRAGRLEQQLGHRKRSRKVGEAGVRISHRPAGQP